MTHQSKSSALLELAERHRGDIIALDDARTRNIYGGCFDAFNSEAHLALKGAGLVRYHIPAGCMAPLAKLTPKGVRVAAALRSRATGAEE